MEWFPLYVAKFESATRGWTMEAKGCYITLLDHQWMQGDVPADPELLRAICSPASDWPSSWRVLASKFPKFGKGKRRNRRLEEVRGEQQEKSERRRRAGRIGRAAQLDTRPAKPRVIRGLGQSPGNRQANAGQSPAVARALEEIRQEEDN